MYLPERKAMAATTSMLQLCEAIGSFGKGLHTLIARVLNRLIKRGRRRNCIGVTREVAIKRGRRQLASMEY